MFKIFHIKLGTEAIRLVLEKTDDKPPVEKIAIIISIYLDFILYYDYKFVKYFLSLSLNNEIFSNPPGALNTFLKDYINEAFKNGDFNPKYDTGYIYRAIFSSLRGATFDWCVNMGKSDLRSDYTTTSGILLNEFTKK